ncbi:P-loop NTPase fold protein [Synechococcus sp. PCC 7336]|uniref:P-loop NTPase fold protein n=1 Tax=Synechococcus sp. PCC 7336 TaxID=195250 RepID=UPI0003471F56|nr:P-loop NTPase fold protein [Synechococcus sp. PCC 7336]
MALSDLTVEQQQAVLRALYNAFDPREPLPAGSQDYVNCREVRGDEDVFVLGKAVCLSDRKICRLYTGHRGAGKSTELLRLQQYLEERGFRVVYFSAVEDDINPEDAKYIDILLACTRQILEQLQEIANPNPVLEWLRGRWTELKEFVLTDVAFEKLSVTAQISQFAKLTAIIRAEPDRRKQIRQRVSPHTTTLIEALNQFIREAKQKLAEEQKELVAIADSLDRIVPDRQEDGKTNLDEIFIDRSDQLKGLECHSIYTIPLSMVYSQRANILREIYGPLQHLPMVMVRTEQGETYANGLEKMQEVVKRRVKRSLLGLGLELDVATEVFDELETLNGLCLMSGGHARNLLLLMQEAILRTDELPIGERAVRRAIMEVRDVFRRTVQDGQWTLLAEVERRKQLTNRDAYRDLLFNRCILEYRYLDDDDALKCWYDVHPVIRGIQEFQQALEQYDGKSD